LGKVWTDQTGWTDPEHPGSHDFLKKKHGHQSWEGSPGYSQEPEAEEEVSV